MLQTVEIPTATQPELIFVYNANATVFSVAVDFFHKLFAPATYQCNLCRVTYGPFTMRQEWKQFLDDLPYMIKFYHKDQFSRVVPEAINMTFPAIFIRANGVLRVLISSTEVNRISTVAELKSALSAKLDAFAGTLSGPAR